MAAAANSLTAVGCSNLKSVFTSFGFQASDTTAVSTQWTDCGCKFNVALTGAQKAAANCGATTGDTDVVVGAWTVFAISVANPPQTLQTFPAVLITPNQGPGANPEGFTRLTTLSFTNKALNGNALIDAQLLPSWTQTIDISDNPGLATWPRYGTDGQWPGISITSITQNNDGATCCPQNQSANVTVACTPAPTVSCTGQILAANATTTTTLVSSVASTSATTAGASGSAPPASSTAFTTTAAATGVKTDALGNVVSTSTDVPFVSPPSAPGSIIIIAVFASLIVGALIVGTITWYAMKNQKQVVVPVDDEGTLGR
ncbi:hypothetical protein BC830DRAFT_1172560 [Chytriomyces sp. MP71]|nr:hypothetical protein BC830DRAFT_1172560 [Chytriomyces sp. MP71]